MSSFDPTTHALWNMFVIWYKKNFHTENNPDYVSDSEVKLCWSAFLSGAKAAEFINKGPRTFIQNRGSENG